MPTIRCRPNRNGENRFFAQARVKGAKPECKTFDSEHEALAWATERENLTRARVLVEKHERSIADARTSLYRLFSEDDVLLYVGISWSAIDRMSHHMQHKRWFSEVSWINVQHFDNRRDALVAERAAIIKEHPKYNVKHRTMEVSAHG